MHFYSVCSFQMNNYWLWVKLLIFELMDDFITSLGSEG